MLAYDITHPVNTGRPRVIVDSCSLIVLSFWAAYGLSALANPRLSPFRAQTNASIPAALTNFKERPSI
ncbi:MAG: hypothetical protein AABY93_18025 [Bacteroidota bacterium]